MYHKWQSNDVWFLRNCTQQTDFFVILDHFLPFYPTNDPKYQNFEKVEKLPGDIIILHRCYINYNHMMHGSWDTKRNGQNFLSFWTCFYPFTPLKTRKIKILKKWKTHPDVLSFYTNVPKFMIICYTVPEIWRVTDVIVIFQFGLLFALLPPWLAWKMKISKKWKKHLETSSFYTSVPKIMIIYYTALEIWCVTDVIVIFHFGLFLPFYPPNSPKNQNVKKMKKDACRYHNFTHVYQKLWLDDVQFLRNGARRTEGRTDCRTDGKSDT